MRVRLWKGYHGPVVRKLVQQAWSSDDELLILCPPNLESFPGFDFLPAGEVTFHGDWSSSPQLSLARAQWPGVEKPVLGLFTTGTTEGEARLVLYSKACVRASVAGILSFFERERLDAIFCYPQPFHTFGLLLGYLLALELDVPLVAPEGKYSSSFHRARAAEITPGLLTLGTPTHFQDLLAQGVQLRPSYSAIVGGASVSRELWHRLRDELHISHPSIGYGNTEASPGVSHLPAGHAPLEDGEIGFPVPGLELRLIPGEGYEFRGPSVCLAIISADGVEFPRSIFIADELRRREDGVLIFKGRTDLVLNRGGEKYSLEAIERGVLRETGCEVLAFAVPHPRLGFELGLMIRGGVEHAKILAILQNEFALRPETSFFRQVAEFPLNSRQKVDRRAALVDIDRKPRLDGVL